jgi:hypothetical protein
VLTVPGVTLNILFFINAGSYQLGFIAATVPIAIVSKFDLSSN